MAGVNLKRCAIGLHGVIDFAGSLERDCKVEAWIWMSGQQLASPLKLRGGFVELALLEVEDASTKTAIRAQIHPACASVSMSTTVSVG